jgi:hypothetical protein
LIWSPDENWSLPVKMVSHAATAVVKLGLGQVAGGMETSSPLSRSLIERPSMASATAFLIWPLKRRMKRWRLTALLFCCRTCDR